jgi:hypothetical protein
MRVLLAAAADGYAASYLNQPLELPGRPAGALPPRTPRRQPRDLLA